MPFDSTTSRPACCPTFAIGALLVGALALVLSAGLGGCTAAVVGGAAVAAKSIHDRRSAGTIVEDQSIELKLGDRLNQEGGPGRGNRIKVVSHNYQVLLVGEVRDPEARRRAVALAESLPQVRRVVDELAVQEPVSLGQRSRDNLLTSRIKASLVGLGVGSFVADHVNVTTARGNVYLMGLLTRTEAEAVVERVRRQRGVNGVYRVFEYIDSPPS